MRHVVAWLPARALDDVRRAVDGARRAVAVPASRSLVTGGRARSDWLRQFAAPLVVAALQHRGDGAICAARRSAGVDAALLTGLLDITGGPFNPFIVMYAMYIWLGAVAVSPRWAVVVSVASAVGFGWLVVDHLQAEMHRTPSAERLSDASLHDVVLGRGDCGARRALRRPRAGSPRATAAAARRSARARGTERAVGVVDDPRGRRSPRVVDAARDDRGGRRRARAKCRPSVRTVRSWSGSQGRCELDSNRTGSLPVDSRRHERTRRRRCSHDTRADDARRRLRVWCRSG